MLPNPQGEPTGLLKQHIRFQVPLAIVLKLSFPPFGIVDRPCRVFRAAMPEAAVYKDSNLGGGKDQIGFSADSFDGSTVDEISQALFV
jgi:hypothetical protein